LGRRGAALPARTAKWHFVDIPIGQSRLDMERDCPAGNCIVGEIAELRRELRDPATSRRTSGAKR